MQENDELTAMNNDEAPDWLVKVLEKSSVRETSGTNRKSATIGQKRRSKQRGSVEEVRVEPVQFA